MARPKPPIASWIVRERKRLGLKPADLVTRLAAQGITVSEQTIRVWESNAGRNPSAENREALARIFGSQEPLEATESRDELAEAIRAQTAAITALVTEIRVAALTVLSAQAGTGDLLARLVDAAESGTLATMLTELREPSVR